MIEKLTTHLMYNYKDIIYINLTFLGTIIAIFFTLISLPLQNILGQYSQDLVKYVKEDKFFTKSLILFLILFAYNLILFILSRNPLRICLSLSFGFLTLWVFWKLIIRIYYLMDIRNQMEDISDDIIKQMASKITESEEVEKTKKITFETFPVVKESNVKFAIPVSFSEWLKSKSDIIIDVTHQSIKKDRFEIVESGFLNLLRIVKEYIKVRKDYKTEDDPYFKYILNKFRDSKRIVSETTHPKIMELITNITGAIAKETLELKPIMARVEQNFIPSSFLLFLREIILSKEILHETSHAVYDACDQFIKIIKYAIDKKYSASAAFFIRELGELGIRITRNINILYADYIARKINEGLINLFYYVLNDLRKIENYNYRKIYLNQCTEEINRNIKEYLKRDNKGTTFNPINPFTGINPTLSISKIFGNIILKKEVDIDDLKEILEYIENFLYGFQENVESGIEKKRIIEVYDFHIHICVLSIYLIELTVNIDNEELKEKTKKILDSNIFYILLSGLSESSENLEKITYPFGKFFDFYTFVLGIMFMQNKNNIFTEIINKWVKEIIKLIKPEREIIYNYLKLIGSWYFKFLPKSQNIKSIKTKLKRLPKKKFDYSPHVTREITLYLKLRVLGFYGDYIEKLEAELFNAENEKKFEEYLNKEK